MQRARWVAAAALAIVAMLSVTAAFAHERRPPSPDAVAAPGDPTAPASTGSSDASDSPAPAHSGRPRGWAVASVKASVLRDRAGAPIPPHTIPMVSSKLGDEVASLTSCDYGIPHDNTGGRLCLRGDTTASRTFVVLGDSHARHWVPAFQAIARSDHWRAYYLAKQQCTAPLVRNGDPALAHPTQPWQACSHFRQWAIDTIGQLDPDVVVVSASVPTGGVFTPRGYIDRPSEMVGPYRRGYRRLWQRLQAVTDARLVLLRDVPARAHGTAPATCLTAPKATLRTCLGPETSPAHDARTAMIEASVAEARRDHVEVVDPSRFFCWDGSCPAVIGHYLPYRNPGHITVEYARHLARPLGWFLGL